MAYAALDPAAPFGTAIQHNVDIYTQLLQIHAQGGTDKAAHYYNSAAQAGALAPRPVNRPFTARLTCLIGPCSATEWLPLWLDYHAAIFGPGALGVMVLPQGHLPAALRSLCRRQDIALYPGDGSADFFAQTREDLILCGGPETLIGAVTHKMLSLSPIDIKFGLASIWRTPQRGISQFVLDAIDLSMTRFHIRDEPAINLVARHAAPPAADTGSDPGPPQIMAIKLPVIYAPQTALGTPGTLTLVSQSVHEQLQSLLARPLVTYGLGGARPGEENAVQKSYDFCDIDRFSAADYIDANPTLAKTPAAAFLHFCQTGYRGGLPYKKQSGLVTEPIARLERFRADYPDRLDGVLPLKQYLGNPDLLPSILAVFEAYLEKFPNNTALLMAAKQGYIVDQDFTRAVELVMHALSIAPDSPQALHQAIDTLNRAGRHDEAETWVACALARFPGDVPIVRAAADVAAARADRQTIGMRWQALLRLLPDDAVLYERAAELHHAGLFADTDLAAELERRGAFVMNDQKRRECRDILGLNDDEAIRRALLRFESLGRSCEFGLVQRRYGAEPISLFRWNGIAVQNLIMALEQRFAGFDDETNIYLGVAPGEYLHEYVVKDKLYKTAMHAHIYKQHAPEATVLHQQRRRVKYLARKLTEDLEAGDKIFVVTGAEMPQDRLLRLWQAIRAFGPGKLLVVTAQRARAGTIEPLEDGLVRGYLNRVGVNANESWNIDFENWLRVLRDAGQVLAGGTA